MVISMNLDTSNVTLPKAVKTVVVLPHNATAELYPCGTSLIAVRVFDVNGCELGQYFWDGGEGNVPSAMQITDALEHHYDSLLHK